MELIKINKTPFHYFAKMSDWRSSQMQKKQMQISYESQISVA